MTTDEQKFRPVSATTSRSGLAYWMTLAAIVAVGLCLRWWNLGGESLWFDEAYTAFAAQQTPARLIELVRVDNSPPLYYLLMRFWTAVFGESEFSLRAPSALAGSIALILTAYLARRWLDDQLSELVAVALAAVSFLLIRYAHEARGYEIFALAALSAAAGMPAWCERGRIGAMILVAMSLSAMTWIHNTAWLYVGGFAVAKFVLPTGTPTRLRLSRAIAPIAIVLVLFLPWLATLTRQMQKMGGGFWIPTPALTALYYTVVTAVGVKPLPVGNLIKESFGRLQPMWNIVQIAIAGAMLAVVIPFFTARDSRRRRIVALAIAAVLPIFAAFVISRIGTSIFTPKAFVPAAAILPLVVGGAIAISRGSMRGIALAGAGAFIVLSLTSVVGQFRYERKEDWRGVHAFVAERTVRPMLLVFVGNDGEIAFNYYERRVKQLRAERTGAPVGFFDNTPPRAMQRVSDVDDLRHLDELIARNDFSEVILISCHTSWSDPTGRTRKRIEELCERIERRNFSGVTVENFTPRKP